MCFSTEIEPNLEVLTKFFDAQVDANSYSRFAAYQQKHPQIFKSPAEDNRLFPNIFAPVVIKRNGKKVIVPMRYRVRPAESPSEVPAKFNLYNARRDSLENRATWKSLIRRQHGLFPFVRFYEWVEKSNGKKAMVAFNPSDRELMWAPCLYDTWEHPKGKYQFHSFALITTDPPLEVENAGHDRCPIFLKENAIESWLDAGDDSLEALDKTEEVYYFHQFVERKKKKVEQGQLKLF